MKRLAAGALMVLLPASGGLANAAGTAPGDLRIQPISKHTSEADWPFAKEKGYLVCTEQRGQRFAFFFEDLPEQPNLSIGDEGNKGALLSIDPTAVDLSKIGNLTVFARTPNLKELLRRLVPYAALGEALCDQPPGTMVGDGEL